MAHMLRRWEEKTSPTETALRAIMVSEGMTPYRWANGPGDTYAAHSHDYHKVLYCLEGSITFALGEDEVLLGPGDRLELQSGTSHSAVVGASGVVCLEAQRNVVAASEREGR